MKVATPVGPSVLMRVSATATHAACATTGRRWNAPTSEVTAVGWTYWLAIPTTIASTTDVVTSGELWPQAGNSRVMTSPAREDESALKKIHAKQTMWKVRTRPSHTCAR